MNEFGWRKETDKKRKVMKVIVLVKAGQIVNLEMICHKKSWINYRKASYSICRNIEKSFIKKMVCHCTALT